MKVRQAVVVFLSVVGCALASFAAEQAKMPEYSSIRGFNFQPPWGSNGRDIWLEKFDPVEYRRQESVPPPQYAEGVAVLRCVV